MAQIMIYYAALTVMAQVLLAAFQCPELQNQALIPDPHDCRKYYHCLPGGRVFPMQCPNGLVFDSRQKVCIWDSTAKSCAPDTELSPPAQQQTSDKVSHKMSHSKGNESRAKASTVTAPHQTNKRENSPSKARLNDEPKGMQTKRKSQLATAATTSTTRAAPTTTTRQSHSTESENSRAKSEGAGSALEKHLSATVDVPSSKNLETAPHTQSTSKDTPASVTTTIDSTNMGDNPSTVTSVPLPSLESKNHETGEDSSRSRGVVKEADMGAHSVRKRSPEDKGLDNYVTNDIRCPSGYAYVPDPSNCATFYHCYNWQPMKKMCPPGLFFDHQTFVCNWPHNVNCIEGYRAKSMYSFNHFRRDRNGARALTFSSESTARPLKDTKQQTLTPARATPTISTTPTPTTELRTTSTSSTQPATQPLTSRRDSVDTDSTHALFEDLGSVSTTTTEEIQSSVSLGQNVRLGTGDDATEKPRDHSSLGLSERENVDENRNNSSRSTGQTAGTTTGSPTSDVSHELKSVQLELYSKNNDLKMKPDRTREVSKSVTSMETTKWMKNTNSDPTGVQTAAPYSVSDGITTGAHSMLTSASNLHDSSSHANDTQPAQVHQTTASPGEGRTASDTSPQTSHSSVVSLAADTTTVATPPPSSGTAHNSSTPLSVMAARAPFFAVSSRQAAPVSAYHRGSRLRARTLLPPRQTISASPFMRPSMAASAFRTPPSQQFRNYDDVSIEKFMIKLLNDAMRSRRVVSREVSGSTTSNDVTPPGLKASPRSQVSEATDAVQPLPAVSNAADDGRKIKSNDGKTELDEKIDEKIEDADGGDAYVQEERAPSTLFFLLPDSGLDFGTSTVQQDMRVSGTSQVDAQTYRQALELSDDQKMFSKKTASFPFAAREADNKDFENLVVKEDVKDETHGKQTFEDLTMKPDKHVMIGSEADLSDTKSDELLLQVGHAHPSIYSGLGDEADLSGDGESPEVMNLIPKIQAFSGISAFEEQTNSTTDHLNSNKTDNGPAVSLTTEDASAPAHDNVITKSVTLAVFNTEEMNKTNLTDSVNSGSSQSLDDKSQVLPSDNKQPTKVVSKMSFLENVTISQLSAQTEDTTDTNTTDTAGQPSVTQTRTTGSTTVLDADLTQTAASSTSALFAPNDAADTARNGTATSSTSTPFTTTNGFSSFPSAPKGNTSISEAASAEETHNNSSLTQFSSSADTTSVNRSQSYTTSLSDTTNVTRSQTYITSPSDTVNITQSQSASTLSSGNLVTLSLSSSTALSDQPLNTSTESSTVPADNHNSTWLTGRASTTSDSNANHSSRNTSAALPTYSTPSADVTTNRLEDASNASFSVSAQQAEVFKAKDLVSKRDETTKEADKMAGLVTVKMTTHDNTSLADVNVTTHDTSLDDVKITHNTSLDDVNMTIHDNTSLEDVNVTRHDSTSLDDVNMTGHDNTSLDDVNMTGHDNTSLDDVNMTGHDNTSLDDVDAVQTENVTLAPLTRSSSHVSGLAVLFRSSDVELKENDTALSNNGSQVATTSNATTTSTTTLLVLDTSSSSSAIIAQNISKDINASSEFLAEADLKVMSDDATNTETSTSVWRLAEGTPGIAGHEGHDKNETVAENYGKPSSGEETHHFTTHNVTSQTADVTPNTISPSLEEESLRSSILVISMEPSFSDPKVESHATNRHPAEDAIQRVHATEAAQVQNVSHNDAVNTSIGDMSKSASIDGNAQPVITNSTANVTDEIIGDKDEERGGSPAVDHLPVVYLSQGTLLNSSANELFGSKGDNTNELVPEKSSVLSAEQDPLSDVNVVQQVHEASSQWGSVLTSNTSLSLQSEESGMAGAGDDGVNDANKGHETTNVPDAPSEDQTAQQDNVSTTMSEADDVTSVSSPLSEAPSAEESRTTGAQTEGGQHARRQHDNTAGGATINSNTINSSGSPGSSNQTTDSTAEEKRDVKTDDVTTPDNDTDDTHDNDVTADNVARPDGTDRDVAPETDGAGAKRSFVSLTDLITWYLKHWRNYTRWRQEHTTLPPPTSGQ